MWEKRRGWVREGGRKRDERGKEKEGKRGIERGRGRKRTLSYPWLQ